MRKRLGLLLAGLAMFAMTGCDLEDLEEVTIHVGGFGVPSYGFGGPSYVIEEEYYEDDFYYEEDYGYDAFDCLFGC